MNNSHVGRAATVWSILIGILLIVAGVFAIAVPLLAGIAASVVLSWLILVAGIFHLAFAWTERGAGAIVWQILIGFAYVTAGIVLLGHPLTSILAMTLVLVWYIAAEGIFEIVLFAQWRRQPGSIWLLLDAIVSLIVACLIFMHWPASSVWAIGTLVGVSLVMSGIARLVMPTRRRKLFIEI